MVIHQPRPEIFNALDELLFLAPGGLTVYQGPQRLVRKYFQDLGNMGLEEGDDNVADALMDMIAVNADQLVETWQAKGKKLGRSLFFRGWLGGLSGWRSEGREHSAAGIGISPLGTLKECRDEEIRA